MGQGLWAEHGDRREPGAPGHTVGSWESGRPQDKVEVWGGWRAEASGEEAQPGRAEEGMAGRCEARGVGKSAGKGCGTRTSRLHGKGFAKSVLGGGD